VIILIFVINLGLPVKQASKMNREMEKIIMPKDEGKKYLYRTDITRESILL
jgi:hypothetical protein